MAMHSPNPAKARAELHIALLGTLSATLVFTSVGHPGAKLVGAIVAAAGCGKIATHWLCLRAWLSFAVSLGVSATMSVNFWNSAIAALGHRSGTLAFILGPTTGLLFLGFFQRTQSRTA
jgi:hypothetical protein